MTKYNGWDTQAEKDAALDRVDKELGKKYQDALTTIIGGPNVSDEQKTCLLAFNDNPTDRAVAQKLAEEMTMNGVVVMTTASLGPGFEYTYSIDSNVLKALQNGSSDGLDPKAKHSYDQLKNAPAAFIVSNDSIADRGFRKLHATHNGAGNAFTSVHVGKVNRSFDPAKIAQIHNADLKPEEHPMDEKAAKAAIDNTLRADHWNDNLYAETDGTDKSNEDAVKIASKEVNQMVAERVDLDAVEKENQFDVFISYQWDRQQEAVDLALKLSGPPNYLKVYLDLDRMHQSIPGNMSQNVRRSKMVVAMHSDLYSTSKNCQAEHNAAKQANIPMYTVHVGDPPHNRLPVDSGTPIRPYNVNQSDQTVKDIVSTVAEITANQTPTINDQATMLDREGAEAKLMGLQNDVAAMKEIFGSTVDLPQPKDAFINSTEKQSVGILFDGNTQETAAKQLQKEILAKNPNADVQLHSIQSLAATYSHGGLPPVHGRSFILCENLRGSQHTVAENNMCSLYMSNQSANTSVCIGTKDQVFKATPDLLGVRAVDMEGASKVIQNDPSIGQPHLNLVSVGNEITQYKQKAAEVLQDCTLQLANLKEMSPVELAQFAMRPLLGTGVLTAEEERICATTQDFDSIAKVFYEASERLKDADDNNPHRELVDAIDETLVYCQNGAFETAEERQLASMKILGAMGLSGPTVVKLFKENDVHQNVGLGQAQAAQPTQQAEQYQDDLTAGA